MTDQFSQTRSDEVDSGHVLRYYETWPSLAREGYRSRVEMPSGRITSACVMGMGGSAAAGEILAGWLAGRRGPEVPVYKGHLPAAKMRGVLAIAVSASGETQETVSMMKEAVKRKALVVSITAGGTLMKLSRELGVPVLEMSEFPAPRYSLPFIIFASLSLISRGLAIDCKVEAEKAIEGMDAEAKEVSIHNSAPRNPAKSIALRLLDKTPAIYGARVVRGVGIRFENVLNENSKKHAHFDEIPDVLHNEVEAWEDTGSGFAPLVLRHSAETAEESRKSDLLVSLLQERGKEPMVVRGRGNSLAQLVTMAYRLDMASYYIALGLGRDPLPTPFIDGIKAKSRAT